MSEVKTNVWTEVLSESMRKTPLVFVVRWRIPKENHQAMVDMVTGSIGNWGMDSQRQEPLKVFYSRTRHWFRPETDGATEEWWFMDEYDNIEAFEAMQKSVVENRFSSSTLEKQQARHRQLLSLMLPGTTLEPTIYCEVESARIEFEPYKIRAAALARASNA